MFSMLWLNVLILSIFLSTRAIHCLIESGDLIITSLDHFNSIWSFAYTHGGSLHINVSLDDGFIPDNNSSTLQYMVCSDNAVRPLVERGVTLDDVCNVQPFNLIQCNTQTILNNQFRSDQLVIQNIDSDDTYRLYSLNCDTVEWHTTIDIVALNSNHEYLDNDQLYYKYIYTVLAGAYTWVSLIWMYHIYQYKQWNITLQTLLLLVPSARILLCMARSYTWNQAAMTGLFDHRYQVIVLVLNMIDTCTLFTILTLCSLGYGIITNSMRLSYMLYYAGICVIIILSKLIIHQYRDTELLLLVICNTVSLRYLFGISMNAIDYILQQVHILDNTSVRYKRSYVYQKLVMIRHIQVCIIAYIAITVLIKLFTTVFQLQSLQWIISCIDESCSICLIACIAYVIRMKPFDPLLPYMLLASKDEIQQNNTIYTYTNAYVQPASNIPSPSVSLQPYVNTTPRTANSTISFMQSAQLSLLHNQQSHTQTNHSTILPPTVQTDSIQSSVPVPSLPLTCPPIPHNAIRLYRLWCIGKQWMPGCRVPQLPSLQSIYSHCYSQQYDIRPIVILHSNNEHNTDIIQLGIPTQPSNNINVQYNKLFYLQNKYIYTIQPPNKQA